MRSLLLVLALLTTNAFAAAPVAYDSWNFGKGEVAVGESAAKVKAVFGNPDKVERKDDQEIWIYARNDRVFHIGVGLDGKIVSIAVGR